jgi:hypothetical protein
LIKKSKLAKNRSQPPYLRDYSPGVKLWINVERKTQENRMPVIGSRPPLFKRVKNNNIQTRIYFAECSECKKKERGENGKREKKQIELFVLFHFSPFPFFPLTQ